MNSQNRQPISDDIPRSDGAGRLACEVARVLGPLIGLGALPLLRERLPEHFWIAGLAAGVLALAAAAFHAVRLAGGSNAVATRLAAGLRGFAARLAVALRAATVRLRSVRLRMRSPAVAPPPAAPQQAAPATDAGPAAPRPNYAFAIQTALIGGFLLGPAVLAFALRRQNGADAALLEIYLSIPAILVWIAGEVALALPLLDVKPKHAPEVSGLLRSVLQASGALLLWIYLGLAVGTRSLMPMFWPAAALAVAGLLLAVSQADAAAPEEANAPSGSEAEARVPAGAGSAT